VLAGDILATGAGVRRFRAGERVYAFTTMRMGAYAQYACVAESKIVARAPENLTAAEVATLQFALSAARSPAPNERWRQGVRRSRLTGGNR
jgi:NADPH:quinone reductase-like Zn-dependent oxidoreductase